jgi:hypothetical protein
MTTFSEFSAAIPANETSPEVSVQITNDVAFLEAEPPKMPSLMMKLNTIKEEPMADTAKEERALENAKASILQMTKEVKTSKFSSLVGGGPGK